MPVAPINIIGMTDEVIDVTISLDAEVVEELRRALRASPKYPRDFTYLVTDIAVVNAVAHALAEQHPEPPTYKVGDLIDFRFFNGDPESWFHAGRTVLAVGDDWIVWREPTGGPVARALPSGVIRPHVEGTP